MRRGRRPRTGVAAPRRALRLRAAPARSPAQQPTRSSCRANRAEGQVLDIRCLPHIEFSPNLPPSCRRRERSLTPPPHRRPIQTPHLLELVGVRVTWSALAPPWGSRGRPVSLIGGVAAGRGGGECSHFLLLDNDEVSIGTSAHGGVWKERFGIFGAVANVWVNNVWFKQIDCSL